MINRKVFIVIACFVMVFFVKTASADIWQCGSELVQIGDYEGDVLAEVRTTLLQRYGICRQRRRQELFG